MKVKVNSIYHLRRLKAPSIFSCLILLISFMVLNFYINNNILVTVKDEVLINNHEFVYKEDLESIKADDEALIINEKEKSGSGIKYRIANDLNGYVKITYEKKINLFELFKI